MGDMKDYYIDLSMGQEFQLQEDLKEQLKKSNEELISLTKESKENLIIGIRNYFEKYNKLSEKQRYCLACWIIDECDNF